jgi:hypothetical protein
MGLMDKVKAQATQLAQKTQDTARDSMAKFDQSQANRHGDAMLRNLGAVVYAERSGRGTADSAAEIDRLLGEIAAHEAAHGISLTPQTTDQSSADRPAATADQAAATADQAPAAAPAAASAEPAGPPASSQPAAAPAPPPAPAPTAAEFGAGPPAAYLPAPGPMPTFTPGAQPPAPFSAAPEPAPAPPRPAEAFPAAPAGLPPEADQPPA